MFDKKRIRLGLLLPHAVTVKYLWRRASFSGQYSSALIFIQTNDITEKQLAQIALAVQNRWEVPAFVKMHEIVIMDEDGDLPKGHIPSEDLERGVRTIFENLEIGHAFRIQKAGKNKYKISRISGTTLPQWMTDIETPPRVPEGVYECAHCGRWFRTDIELSMHTKIHYII
jgi:hypothetical protein